mmetsp:Transcript_2929/g.6638  ORF Transcript_2929/g.6638 Transcript_2929/m.6638 type:complete len:343 (-) Transcript_2929:1006-2034(-)
MHVFCSDKCCSDAASTAEIFWWWSLAPVCAAVTCWLRSCCASACHRCSSWNIVDNICSPASTAAVTASKQRPCLARAEPTTVVSWSAACCVSSASAPTRSAIVVLSWRMVAAASCWSLCTVSRVAVPDSKACAATSSTTWWSDAMPERSFSPTSFSTVTISTACCSRATRWLRHSCLNRWAANRDSRCSLHRSSSNLCRRALSSIEASRLDINAVVWARNCCSERSAWRNSSSLTASASAASARRISALCCRCAASAASFNALAWLFLRRSSSSCSCSFWRCFSARAALASSRSQLISRSCASISLQSWTALPSPGAPIGAWLLRNLALAVGLFVTPQACCA